MIGATYPALYGLLGYPLGHSFSPVIHEAALRAVNLPGAYVALPVPGERLDGAMAGVRAWRLPGLSVTVPHKVAVMSHLDEVTPLARRIGAVNTLYWESGKLCGDNTDYEGLRTVLRDYSVEGRQALVLGAGGAARATVLALADAGAATVHLVARRESAAQHLVAELLEPAKVGRLLAFEDEPDIAEVFTNTMLVINATPVGMHGPVSPISGELLRHLNHDARVLDLIYNPAETKLMADARALGLRAENGAEMLLHQAAVAFERWTGVTAPIDVMRAALNQALMRRSQEGPCA